MESSDEENDGVSGNYVPKELSRLASNGAKFVDEVLNGQNERCLENFRMDKHVFYKLCDILQTKGLLRHTNRIKIEEQLAIFMFIIGHNLRIRAVQELFRYSGETISRHFNNVLNAIMSISRDFFQPPGSDHVPSEIFEDPRFYPYFRDCVGAIDGIHVPVTVGVDEQGPFRNKDGLLSQNILAACSFDLKFHYVLAGWEGSATDLQVFNSAITRRNRLQVPEGKYYLVDNKYPNVPGFIAPYSGTPYHSKEFPSGYHPQYANELFNQRHSLLRNVTDRTFGALKARFPILMSTPSYPLQTQVKLVVAACALHNYIRGEKPDDWLFKMYGEEASFTTEESLPPLEVEVQPKSNVETQIQSQGLSFGAEEIALASQLRDSIATNMWNDFIHDFAPMQISSLNPTLIAKIKILTLQKNLLLTHHSTTMLDPATELVPPPASPSISSISSSDLDTESTGSFFHDRSTTLGTLMGVSFPAIAFRVPSQHHDPHFAAGAGGSKRNASNKKKKRTAATAAAVVAAQRRRRWWQLCREGDAKPASLGEFLEVERRVGDGAFYGTAAELEGMVAGHQQRNGGRVLFADGRVLPPAADVDDGESAAMSLCNRFPVSLAGICSGGAG